MSVGYPPSLAKSEFLEDVLLEDSWSLLRTKKSRGFLSSFPVDFSFPSCVKRKFARRGSKEPTLTNDHTISGFPYELPYLGGAVLPESARLC
jgi:hypothetical protein